MKYTEKHSNRSFAAPVLERLARQGLVWHMLASRGLASCGLACRVLAVAIVVVCAGGARASEIGVLSDGRQAEFLSLMGDSSAEARGLLTDDGSGGGDGHTLVELATLTPASMATLDVVWLPMLDTFSEYTAQERTDLAEYVNTGGAVVFIGGPDVFNVPDDSMLSAFGLSKLTGNLTLGLTPSLPGHAAATGPFGTVGTIGSGGGYGLFNSIADVADVFEGINEADPPEPGTLAGFMDASSGYAGAGRIIFLCDPFMFGQYLDQSERDHPAMLRNLVAWAARESGYTPSGSMASSGAILEACDACTSVEVVYETVSATGFTSVASLGSGRCGFDGIPDSALPTGLTLLGYGFSVATSAAYTGSIDVTVTLDGAMLSALGVTDPSALRLWRYDSAVQELFDITTVVDAGAVTVTGQATSVGSFVVGAIVPDYEDCDGNNIPDECQGPVELTVAVDAAGGGSAGPDGVTSHVVCETVDISASADAEHCFGGWTVAPAAATPPADPAAAATTIVVDADKTVTARFLQVIEQQPADTLVCEGEVVSLTVQVHAELTATYQWRLVGEDIAGATSATLSLAAAGVEDAGQYDVVVTVACGSFTSETAAISVATPPVITTQPAFDYACMGGSFTLAVETSGTGPQTFQWYKNGEAIDGAELATLTIEPVALDDAGSYTVTASNDCGMVTSEAVEVVVEVTPTVNVQPVGGTLCAGEAITLSVGIDGGGPLTHQWRKDGVNLEGATDPTYVIDPAIVDDAGEYDVVVQNANGCGAVVSATAEVIVNAGPMIVQQPSDQAVCQGSVLTISLDVSGTPPLNYQWRKDGADIPGATGSNLVIESVGPQDAASYDVVIVSGLGCGSVTSEPAVLTVPAQTQITNQPAGETVCAGATTTLSVGASGSNLTYQWQFQAEGQPFVDLIDDDSASGTNTDTLSLLNIDIAGQGGYRCRVNGDCGGPLDSNAAQVVVNVAACDCNSNGVPDGQDIAGGTSQDCNNDGVPDDCQLAGADCNADGIPDACQLDDNDCNADGVPDDCQLVDADCNADGIPDACQLVGNDCNGNNVPDDCEPPFVADTGADLDACVGQSLLFDAPVIGGLGVPPYSLSWQIVSGPDAGATIIGPTLERPSFLATVAGTYGIELTVADASNPPCVTSDLLMATAEALSLDAGATFSMCATGTSEPLMPAITGGQGPFSYAWSIDAGAPSTAPSQFTGGGQQDPNPTFSPDSPGDYVLRLTVTDQGGAGCTATSTIDVHAGLLGVTPPVEFAMCVNRVSAPLALVVSAADPAMVTYEWTIDNGSPDVSASQFGGAGPMSPNPTFSPTSLGTYVLRARVRDGQTPACEQTVTIVVQVVAMTVDAGTNATVCATGDGIRLNPTVVGGYGAYIYSWTIEEGSPSSHPAQFSDPHSFDAAPLFTPTSQGSYTLRLTVRDSATPYCEASDTVVIQSTGLLIDAGADFVTRAYEPSRGLGAIPVAGGGQAPYAYQWRILGAPSTDASQLSDPSAAHPLLTPTDTGTYLIEVAVTDAGGDCVATDTVAIEAITAIDTRIVNSEGRVFMPLRIDAPHTRAELRVSEALPGASFTGELYDAGPAANIGGMTVALTRRISASTDVTAGLFVVVVIMHYDDAEVAGLDEAALRIHWFDTGGRWQAAGTTSVGDQPHPLRAGRSDLGRYGVDVTNNRAWVVLDYVADFAVGIPGVLPPAIPPGPVVPPGETPAPTPTPTPTPSQPTTGDAPMCGAMGSSGVAMSLGFLSAGLWAGRRGRRGRCGPRENPRTRRPSAPSRNGSAGSQHGPA